MFSWAAKTLELYFTMHDYHYSCELANPLYTAAVMHL